MLRPLIAANCVLNWSIIDASLWQFGGKLKEACTLFQKFASEAEIMNGLRVEALDKDRTLNVLIFNFDE